MPCRWLWWEAERRSIVDRVDRFLESQTDLHAIRGIPVDVERLGARGLRAEQHRFQADQQHHRQAGSRFETGQNEPAPLNQHGHYKKHRTPLENHSRRHA